MSRYPETVRLVTNPGKIAREIRDVYIANQVVIQTTPNERIISETSGMKCFILFYPIAEFLSPVEVIKLSTIHRHLNQDHRVKRWIMYKFTNNLYELMNSIGHSALANTLRKYKHPWPFVISGSIVLQALLSDQWQIFDIDIYGIPDKIDTIERLLLDAGYQNFNVRADTMEPYIALMATKTIKSVKDWYNYLPLVNEQARSTVQVIELNDNNIDARRCVDAFDLDIVKNTWDGETLCINNFNSISNMTADVSPHIDHVIGAMGNACGFVTSLVRLYELKQKGVLSIDLKSIQLSRLPIYVESVFDRIFRRFLKYAKRGFIIRTSLKDWTIREITVIINRLGKLGKKKVSMQYLKKMLMSYS
jgi:hypothetical protein